MSLTSIARTWANRANAEHGAEAKFKILTQALVQARAIDEISDMARTAERDEHRHAAMCAEVARDLGHRTGYEPLRAHATTSTKNWSTSNFREALLCEVVLMCCFIETSNSALLHTLYTKAPKSPTKDIVQEIFRDEVKHSQLGWAYLASEANRNDVEFLSQHFPQMLDLAVRDELFTPEETSTETEDAFNYGVLPLSYRLDQFSETVSEIIVPGFQKYGIETLGIQSWLQAKLPTQQKQD